MRKGFQERRENGGSRPTTMGELAASIALEINQPVGAIAARATHKNSKSLLAGSNSSKRGLTIRGMFTPSGRSSCSCAQPGSPAPESDK